MSTQVKMRLKEMLERDVKIIPEESRILTIKKLIRFLNELESHNILHKFKTIYPPYNFGT